jgi:hypothetical protein
MVSAVCSGPANHIASMNADAQASINRSQAIPACSSPTPVSQRELLAYRSIAPNLWLTNFVAS